MKRVWIGFLVVALAGMVGDVSCKKDPSPDGPTPPTTTGTPPEEEPDSQVEKDAAPVAVPDTYACKHNVECEVTCEGRDDCCGQLCQCTNVFHKQELATIRTANQAKCKGKRDGCPVAGCTEPTTDFVPRCESGACKAASVPRYRRDKNYSCKKDNDCVVAKDQPNDCCGQLCWATNVYHKDELAAIQAVNDKRCDKSDRYSCPKAKCALTATQVVAKCVKNRCEGKEVPRR